MRAASKSLFPKHKPEPASTGDSAPPAEADVAVVVTERVAEEIVAPERERSSYDGDTAIKLYLREIGQVKMPLY